MSKNNFNKELLKRYVQTECERQLLLDLAQYQPERWYSDDRKIKFSKIRHKQHKLLPELGKEYEKKVYSQLKRIKGVKHNSNSSGEVRGTYLNPQLLNQLHYNLTNSPENDLILLEYQFDIPDSFFQDLFNLHGENKQIPIAFGDQRPDIIIIGKTLNSYSEKVLELLPNGEIHEISETESETRYGINIIDIKNIREENIGKKQFIEIFYYLFTLSYYLRENNLDSKYFVSVDYNGIFPQYDDIELENLLYLENIIKMTIDIHWNESSQVFIDVYEKIRELWALSPVIIKNIPVNIQSACGYCHFLEDCKNTLGFDTSNEPKNWSLKLIPYTSMSIAQQLIDLGFHTIEDVYENIDNINIGITPEPIYSEIPLLKLKAEALVKNEVIQAESGHTHTYTIPRYSTISITFAVETDPGNERVYAVGFYLEMVVSPKMPYYGVFDNWWKIWKENVSLNSNSKIIKEKLDEYLIRQIPLYEVDFFYSLLKKLSTIIIALKGEGTKSGQPRKQTRVIYQKAFINKYHNNEAETDFTKEIIKTLHSLFALCNIVENYVVTDGYKAGHYYGPTTSLFYWSKRQLINFQDMLERNLSNIINDISIWGKFLKIISLFTPSDSEVSHPYQHKKMFNLQDFAETIIGFPGIISYTWHEIAKKLNGTSVSSKYWLPHYNYMDFNNWYEMLLEEENKNSQKKMRNEIRRQLMHKIRTISSLRKKFQFESRYAISKYSREISKEQIRKTNLSRDFHPIAQVWYLFSKLTGSMDERNAEYFRTIYPEFSIGKLETAIVSNLQIHQVKKKCFYSFQINGLSSNMKIKIGDRVILIPDEKRDILVNSRYTPWKITIASMRWSSKESGYRIQTELTSANLFEEVINDKEIDIHPENLNWYLYPVSLDVWSKKLYSDNKGLLLRYTFGTTWLGSRLSYLWDVRSKQELFWPESWNFLTPEIYLFAPQLLIDSNKANVDYNSSDLLTPITPNPDPSQKHAINMSLGQVISGIKGPPGTGKSQTIAALVDEYYYRCIRQEKNSVRILLTGFSYASIQVLIDKIRKGKDDLGNPTKTSQLQIIFLRSTYQDPILNQKGLKNVDDLVRNSNGTWKLNDKKKSVTNTHPLEESLDDSFIMFANSHQLYHLPERVNEEFAFDLICVDEASQLPVDYFMSSLQFIHKLKLELKKPQNFKSKGMRINNKQEIKRLELNNKINIEQLTKIIIVGDYNQLPPVQSVIPPKNLENVLESLFAYYVKNHEIPSAQLQINYRSHEDIVNFTSSLGVYEILNAHPNNANRKIEGNFDHIQEKWIKKVLDPNKIVSSIIHDNVLEIGVSSLEAEIVTNIILNYYLMKSPENEEQELLFWKEKIGVVAPHNAQGRLIIRKIFEKMTETKHSYTKLNHSELMALLKNSIYSVEKFQGSDRELIISSIGISDKEQLFSESRFIYNLNRFNVLTSRAKFKVIIVASEKFLNYIPNERKIMQDAAYIHNYAYQYCNKSMELTIKNEKLLDEKIEFRYKE